MRALHAVDAVPRPQESTSRRTYEHVSTAELERYREAAFEVLEAGIVAPISEPDSVPTSVQNAAAAYAAELEDRKRGQENLTATTDSSTPRTR
jgi:hypothetical protein